VAVKRSHSGSRVLTVLEAIAGHQPIGIRALGRLLGEDKSAIQRAVMTLADAGWIRMARQPPARWEVSARILAVAHTAQGSHDLRRRARPLLEQLRDETRETLLLVVPDVQCFVIADVVESRQVLRMVPHVGTIVDARNTATGRALLPFMDAAQQSALLGSEPDAALVRGFASTREHGYAVSDGETNPSALNIAAAIVEYDGSPAGAIVLTAPRERVPAPLQERFGRTLAAAAQELSRRRLADP
jgi:IclR family acetate operon transcriptional repressor